MKILGFEIRKFKKQNKKRRFEAAKYDRLVSDWLQSYDQINDELRTDLCKIRGRSRQMQKDNSYYKRFVNSNIRGVFGATGIQLSMNVVDFDSSGKIRKDDVANDIIEIGWKKWGQSVTLDKSLTWQDFELLAYRTYLIDGECFIQVIEGEGEYYNFSLNFIDANLIPADYNDNLSNGNSVINGIEFNSKGQAVNYYVKSSYNNCQYSKIPAANMIHVFKREFVNQKRGFPSACAAMLALHNLKSYTEAEIVAARLSAAKMGMYINKAGQDEMALADEKSGNDLISNFEPGKFEILPDGWDFKEVDPTHPNGNHTEFTQAMLREVASGVDMAYNQLANDLKNVNYSSLRSGKLDENDHYRQEQTFVIQHLHKKVFRKWLPFFLMSGTNFLPLSKKEKFMADTWIPRSFPWVDPLRDAQANILLIDNDLQTPQKVIAETGESMEDVYRLKQKSNELKEKYDLNENEEVKNEG